MKMKMKMKKIMKQKRENNFVENIKLKIEKRKKDIGKTDINLK